jgi:hypothetical protein
VIRNYMTSDGRSLAVLDAMHEKKTDMAVPIATAIANAEDPNRRVPPKVADLFEVISIDCGLAVRKGFGS